MLLSISQSAGMTAFLASVVVASIISSLASLIVTLINNARVARIEKSKHFNQISLFRYEHLYECLINWHKDIKSQNKEQNNDSLGSIIKSFIDDEEKCDAIASLMDLDLALNLYQLKEKGHTALVEYLNIIAGSKESYVVFTNEQRMIINEFCKIACEFEDLIKTSIKKQLDRLSESK